MIVDFIEPNKLNEKLFEHQIKNFIVEFKSKIFIEL